MKAALIAMRVDPHHAEIRVAQIFKENSNGGTGGLTFEEYKTHVSSTQHDLRCTDCAQVLPLQRLMR